MTAREARRYSMLVRVCSFGNAYGDRLAHSSGARQQFATVAAAVTQLGEHTVARTSAARKGSVSKAEALRAIGRTSRVIVLDTPGIDHRFHLPSPRTDQALLTAGRVFARQAEAFRSEFVTHGMPQTFIAELYALVDTFERAIDDRHAEKSRQTAAKAGMEVALASGITAVRKLDVIVTNQLRTDPVVMAVWRRDRRVGYPGRRRSLASESRCLEP